MKTCIICGKDKNENEFYKSDRFKDGFKHGCKECRADKKRIRNKEYRGKEENKIKQREWWIKNPEKRREYYMKYSKTDKCKRDRSNWHESFKERNPHVLAWRSVLNNSLKRLGTDKEKKTIEMLGYSALELKIHIENQFLEGMTWDNYGEWHIDHIKMVSTFEKEDDIKVVNSLDNLRPLWKKDNCSRKLNKK